MRLPTLMFTAMLVNSAHAADTLHIDLRRGHFVLQADETVETLRVDMLDQPGVCRQVLEPVAVDSLRIELRPTVADCNRDQYAIVRINPGWQPALDVGLGAGQVEVAPSMMAALATLDATVSAGDIFGVARVERRWLVGAHVRVEHQRPGIDLTLHVAGGQISLAAEGASAR